MDNYKCNFYKMDPSILSNPKVHRLIKSSHNGKKNGLLALGFYVAILGAIYSSAKSEINDSELELIADLSYEDESTLLEIVEDMIQCRLLVRTDSGGLTSLGAREQIEERNAAIDCRKRISQAGVRARQVKKEQVIKQAEQPTVNRRSTDGQPSVNLIRVEKSRVDSRLLSEDVKREPFLAERIPDRPTTFSKPELPTVEKRNLSESLRTPNSAEMDALCRSWGSSLVDAYMHQLDLALKEGRMTVMTSRAKAIEGMLRRDEAKGLIKKPAPLAPSRIFNDGKCPICGGELRPGNLCPVCRKFWARDEHGHWQAYQLASGRVIIPEVGDVMGKSILG